MSLYYRYRLASMNRMIVSLGGRTVRPRLLVDVTLVGPSNSRMSRALLDTGADDSIFPEALAMAIGIDLTSVLPAASTNPGLGAIPLRYADVKLRLTDGQEQREWPAIVGFTPAPLYYPVLGFAGCLQYFTATFHGDREEVELTVNALYPGT